MLTPEQALAKFASIVYAANDLAKQTTLAAAGLQELEDVLNISINNTQIYPLVYDQAWKGSVSSASYVSKDPESDFGNTYYNDHHFHYGFFVYTAVTGINQHNSSVTKQPALYVSSPILSPQSLIQRSSFSRTRLITQCGSRYRTRLLIR